MDDISVFTKNKTYSFEDFCENSLEHSRSNEVESDEHNGEICDDNFNVLSDNSLEDQINEEDRSVDKPIKHRNQYMGSIFTTNSTVADIQTDPEVLPKSFHGSLHDFLSQTSIQSEIARKFKLFLRSFESDEEKVYLSRINDIARMGGKSLEVDYIQFATFNPTLGIWVADAPKQMLEILNRSARMVFIELYPDNDNLTTQIYVRFFNAPIYDSLRNIRNIHINRLVRASGLVSRCTGIFPQLLITTFLCGKCGYKIGPFAQKTVEAETKPISCPNCQSRSTFILNDQETLFRNYQKMSLQETPNHVTAGRLPITKQVILLNDLIDSARPGEEVDVTGIFLNCHDSYLNLKNGFPIFNTVIEANFLQRRNLYSLRNITDEDYRKLHKLSSFPDIDERIAFSIAPFIFGQSNVKMAITLALFGGLEKFDGQHRIRGDINVLLLGDSGMAKSQFLKYIKNSVDRTVYTTGKGASAVGLTASIKMDSISHEWTLEGGALVLADRGICLIDEFDKMNDYDRVSIHEAMEQQSISISKAGIVTRLNARCSVIAAANPIDGYYNTFKPLRENVNLSDPILTRFDIVCIIKDIVAADTDKKLAEFVVNSHTCHTNGSDRDEFKASKRQRNKRIIPKELLRKYIHYTKENIKPKLESTEDEKIAKVYAELRKESSTGVTTPISVRQLESTIRMAEAHAKICFHKVVYSTDVDFAIKIMVEGYINIQKIETQEILWHKLHRFVEEKKRFLRYMYFYIETVSP
eukprot:gnl/TRDRNA2_/TRDRNA2_177755_c3_seq2.p1 gnl/TRDRNA2_/TRDRNA2_177755_c3~~gnl/TRDRNA2_/TRDRNA2_177755_c3_seq2.p1  ORF type:complete len:753 (-),score=-12.39 gnl/TRDRNA2_/TRDRNA2_177755_c3_seq2:528-2786(-)